MTTATYEVKSEIVHIEIARRNIGMPGALEAAEQQARRETARRLGVILPLVSPAHLLPPLVKAGQPDRVIYSYECSVTVSDAGS
jgi:hypothetical protein